MSKMKKEESKADEPTAGAPQKGPFFMAPKEIKRLIGILSDAGALELELEDQGTRLRIRMPGPQDRTEVVTVPSPYPVGSFVGAPPPEALAVGPGAEKAESDKGAQLPAGASYLKSPLVGTFYRAASPDTEPFVQVGGTAKSDTTVCIIEAMKVMNEIKTEQECRVLQILVEDGEPVEYGQPLMILQPA